MPAGCPHKRARVEAAKAGKLGGADYFPMQLSNNLTSCTRQGAATEARSFSMNSMANKHPPLLRLASPTRDSLASSPPSPVPGPNPLLRLLLCSSPRTRAGDGRVGRCCVCFPRESAGLRDTSEYTHHALAHTQRGRAKEKESTR